MIGITSIRVVAISGFHWLLAYCLCIFRLSSQGWIHMVVCSGIFIQQHMIKCFINVSSTKILFHDHMHHL